MAARHFEKQRGLRPFRRVGVKGATVEVALGVAANDQLNIRIPKRSAKAAMREWQRWIDWALADGFAELPVPSGGRLGLIAQLMHPTGPGRIRIDGPDDVYFDPTAGAGEVWKVGQRVVTHGLHRDPGLKKVGFMFGYTRRAERVTAAPLTLPSSSPRRTAFDERTTRALLKLAGPAISGHQCHPGPFGKLEPGRLIFAYEKGIHRFLAFQGKFVVYEPVFTSALAPQRDHQFTSCAAEFCAKLPKALEATLSKSLLPS